MGVPTAFAGIKQFSALSLVARAHMKEAVRWQKLFVIGTAFSPASAPPQAP
jgi:hypothetical protein